MVPVATTDPASAVGPFGATLHGLVNPQNSVTGAHFEWGTTTAYGNALPFPDTVVGADLADHAVSSDLTGLAPATTYHYRLVATDDTGPGYGVDRIFTTASVPPAATTDPATAVTSLGATVNATVNPENIPTTYRFDLGDHGVRQRAPGAGRVGRRGPPRPSGL